jgi:hypothetical protein
VRSHRVKTFLRVLAASQNEGGLIQLSSFSRPDCTAYAPQQKRIFLEFSGIGDMC